jgi:hypothetical protein
MRRGALLALLLMSLLLLRPARVDLIGDRVQVRLGWAFLADFPRSAVRSAVVDERRVISLGAHGWRGRWLVNTSTSGLVTMHLDPVQRARVVGIPVSLRWLTVSVEDPDALVRTLEPTG